MRTLAWIIGARGLLGSALSRAVADRSDWDLLATEPLAWGHTDELGASVAAIARRLVAESQRLGANWVILWAAGAAVTSSSAEVLDHELAEFECALRNVEAVVRGHEGGSLFVASSVGGLYGGAVDPPFSESSDIRPSSPYGRFKQRMEHAATEFGERAGVSVLLGRITNLYGPGQRIDKQQGLLTRLAIARVRGEQVFLFVPLETVRDYLFADDAATLILKCLDRLGAGDRRTVVKIIGSGDATSIAALLGYYRAITKLPARVVLGESPSTAFQSVDLRVRSEVWTDLDRFEKTPLAAGFHATLLAAERHALA